MKWSPAWLAIVLGCGSTGTAPTTHDVGRLVVAGATASTAPTPLEVAPIVVRKTQDRFVARVRVSAVRKLEKLAPALPVLEMFARELGLTTNGVLDAVAGLDPDGIVTFEAFELDARGESDVGTLKSLRSTLTDGATRPGLVGELDRASEGFVMARITLKPKNDKPKALIERWLRGTAESERSEVERVNLYVKRRSMFALTEGDGGTLELSFAMARDDLSGERARTAHRALRAWGRTSKSPSLAPGEDAVIEMRPSLIADSAFLFGVALTSAATREVGSPHAEEIAAAGLREASRNLELASPEGNPRYESLVLTVRGTKVEGVATLAREGRFDPAMWAREGANVDFQRSTALIEVNGSLAYGWPLQAARPNENPYAGKVVRQSVREAGFTGMFVIAPDLPFFAVRNALEEAEGVGHATLPFMRRFERLGLAAFEDGSEIIFGLLPKEASDKTAACALSREGAPCAKSEELGADKPVLRNRFWTVRKRVEGRWLILATRRSEATLKEAVTVKVGNRPSIWTRVDIDRLTGAFGNRLSLGLLKAHAELDASGKSYRFQIDIGPP